MISPRSINNLLITITATFSKPRFHLPLDFFCESHRLRLSNLKFDINNVNKTDEGRNFDF